MGMFEIEQTDMFASWLNQLRDARAKAKIAARVQRARFGNFGKVDPGDQGVSEMKIDYGPGYRTYFFKHRKRAIMLLCGGDKSTQRHDIATAKRLAAEIRQRENQ